MVDVIAHRWEPITDLPDKWKDLERVELRALAGVWAQQRQQMEGAAVLEQFNERLQREWAIETGLIERLYTLDRGITQLLIEQGLDAAVIPHGSTDRDPELVAAMINDHKEAVEGLFAFVKGERELSTSYVKGLHAAITRHQSSVSAVDPQGRMIEVPLLKGEYKLTPNNPTRSNGRLHEYCPPEQVAPQMERLVELHATHVENKVPPEIEAAWLHHRFAQIHPFQDGNGRVVRALATIVFLKSGWFPLVVTYSDRERYLDALEKADEGRLEALVGLFAELQKAAFLEALHIVPEVLRPRRVDQAIQAIRHDLDRRQKQRQEEWEVAKDIAGHLQEMAHDRLEHVAEELQSSIGPYSSEYQFRVDNEPPAGDHGFWFRWQIIETAKKHGYFANTRTHSGWVRLVMRTETQSELLVSFHGVGHEFRGVLVVSACFYRREDTTGGERELLDLTPLAGEVFQVNYLDDREEVQCRFADWLESITVQALQMMRKGL